MSSKLEELIKSILINDQENFYECELEIESLKVYNRFQRIYN